jgi:spoIIIJ-associated protein
MVDEEVKVTKEAIDTVRELTEELLSLMEIKAEFKVSEDKKNNAVFVDVDAAESAGLLIGHRGETIAAIQAALGMMARKKIGDFVRIIVNVGDWREKQEEQLRSLAEQAAQRARETGESQPLYNLNAAQRRIIHVILSEEDDIETESHGDGQDRYLVVNLKK